MNLADYRSKGLIPCPRCDQSIHVDKVAAGPDLAALVEKRTVAYVGTCQRCGIHSTTLYTEPEVWRPGAGGIILPPEPS